jgi:sulfide:quinone oxidoreductase
MTETTSFHVVIAGAGVAALEKLMALRDLAGEQVAITLIAPEPRFTYRPMKVAEPFQRGHAHDYALSDIARDHGARFIHDSVAAVDTERQVVRCATGIHVPYDRLVLATGAKPVPAFRHAITFGDDPSEERLHGLLADLEQGYARSVAFVVPSDATWTLPLYEIALMTARQVWGMGIDGVRFTLVTPEERPLAMFGTAASQAVGEMLAAENIEFVGAAYPNVGHGHVVADPSGRRIEVDRVVSLPVLNGRPMPGVPTDSTGFMPIDAHGRVPRIEHVYAAGDGANFPIKQGGLATQQADAVAQAIAAEAGVEIEPQPFRPVLRGLLFTGGDDRYLRHAVAGGGGEPEVAGHALWWPPTKIAGRYISAYLFGRDEAQMLEDIRARRLEVHLPLDAHAAAGHP